MNGYHFTLFGARLVALPSGALWWPEEGLLCASDLHLGKSDRIARLGGALLPPYETRDTLAKLEADLGVTEARCVICLGDSFDDLTAADTLPEAETLWLTRMMAGRRWIWIEGNHDPGPVDLGGSHRAELRLGPLTFRHIAEAEAEGEISGHYHPKARLASMGSGLGGRCFLIDGRRVIMPAFGTYTGGLPSDAPELCALMATDARAVITGREALPIPMPRGRQA